MKSLIFPFFFSILLFLPFTIFSVASAQGNNPFDISSEEIIKNKEYAGNLKDYTAGTDHDGEYQIKALIREQDMPALKRFLIPIAIMFMTWAGVSLILSRGNEDEFKKKFRQALSVMGGFFLFAFSTHAIDWVFFGTEGQILRGDDSTAYAKWGVVEMAGLFKFFSSFAVIVAVVYIVFTAFQLVVHGEDEGELTIIKKRLVYTVVGIAVLLSANWVVMFMVDSDGKVTMPSVEKNIALVMTWANVILGFIGLLAFLSLIYGAVRLIANFGDDQAAEEAKRVIIASLIGLIVAFSAWTIIYFFVNPT